MKTKIMGIMILFVIALSCFSTLPARGLDITSYIVQTNIVNGASGWYNTASSQIQLWWDGTFITLKGPLIIHNVLYEYSNGQWQNKAKVEDTTITLKTSAETMKFDVRDTFNSNWQVTTDRTRELSLSQYSQPTPTPTSPPTATPTPVSTRPMLSAFLGPNAISASQVQTAISSWTAKTGKGLSYYSIMSPFGYSNNPRPMTALDNYKPLVAQGLFQGVIYTWEPSYNDDLLTGGQCISDIVTGKYDSYIHREAQRAKSNGYPIIIRFGHEMNGYWVGWGNDATQFKQAWIKVVDIFRQEGASNVKFFWCPNYNNNPSSRVVANYYPGDSYVDFVGMDLYSNSEYNTWHTPERQFASCNIYETYSTKPFIIGEFGLTNALSDAQNAQWLTGFFDAIDRRNRIFGIALWREDWNGASVDLYPQAFNVYKTRIASYLPI